MFKMVEVDLKIDGKSAFEYESNSAPRVGEFLDISHEFANGVFEVVKVTHRIFKPNEKERTIQYLIVEAVTVSA
jgi:hypothetical protein